MDLNVIDAPPPEGPEERAAAEARRVLDNIMRDELMAMRAAWEALSRLDPDARERAMMWLSLRVRDEAASRENRS